MSSAAFAQGRAGPIPPSSDAGAVKLSVRGALPPDYGGNDYEIRPNKVTFGKAANVSLTSLKWASWGGHRAQANGVARVNTCEPTCAAGNYDRWKASLRVGRRGSFHGVFQYLCFQVTYREGPSAGPQPPVCREGKPPKALMPWEQKPGSFYYVDAAKNNFNYVALGDSYASGVGSTSSPARGNGCRRSPEAYPYLLRGKAFTSDLFFAACSGAPTQANGAHGEKSILGNQVPLLRAVVVGQDITPLYGPQDRDYLDVVTITAGINDLHLQRTGILCRIDNGWIGNRICERSVDDAKRDIRTTLRKHLDKLYHKVAVTSAYSMSAQPRIFVTGYPRIFDLGFCGITMNEYKRRLFNEGIALLDEVIAKEAREAGFEYVPVDGLFEGHRVCSDDPWLNDLIKGGIGAVYHPNDKGHRAYYRALRKQIEQVHHSPPGKRESHK